MALKTSWYRYGMKLHHCNPMYMDKVAWQESVLYQFYCSARMLEPNKFVTLKT